MTVARGIFIALCLALLGGGYYLSSQGVWGAGSGVTSLRGGSYIGIGGRVK